MWLLYFFFGTGRVRVLTFLVFSFLLILMAYEPSFSCFCIRPPCCFFTFFFSQCIFGNQAGI